MNVPGAIKDGMLADYLAYLGFDVSAGKSFRCDACLRKRWKTWRVLVFKLARRGDALIGLYVNTQNMARPAKRRGVLDRAQPLERGVGAHRWCIRCCRTLTGIALSDIVAMRLEVSLRPDLPDIPF